MSAPAASAALLLDAQDVTIRSGGLVAVKAVSFAVAPAEIVGLIWPNRAGKTTLFNALSGHLRANAGRVLFDGADMTRATATAYARARIGRTFHIVKPLATLTVHENVTVGALCVIQSRTRAHAPPLSSDELAWAR